MDLWDKWTSNILVRLGIGIIGTQTLITLSGTQTLALADGVETVLLASKVLNNTSITTAINQIPNWVWTIEQAWMVVLLVGGVIIIWAWVLGKGTKAKSKKDNS